MKTSTDQTHKYFAFYVSAVPSVTTIFGYMFVFFLSKKGITNERGAFLPSGNLKRALINNRIIPALCTSSNPFPLTIHKHVKVPQNEKNWSRNSRESVSISYCRELNNNAVRQPPHFLPATFLGRRIHRLEHFRQIILRGLQRLLILISSTPTNPIINITMLNHRISPITSNNDMIKNQYSYTVQKTLKLQR